MKPFTVLSESEEYRDGNRFSIMRAKMKTPDDREVAWTYMKRNDGVIIVALDSQKNIFIIKQWRVNRKGFVSELPSGWIEVEKPSEKDILEAANRELQEEVGYIGKKLSILISFYIMNHSTSIFHVVLAEDLVLARLSSSDQEKLKDKDGEYLKIEKLPFAKAKKRLLNEQIPSAQVVIALQKAEEYLTR